MKMRLLLTLLCVSVLQAIDMQAQQKRTPLPVEEVLAASHFSFYTPIDLSPDGRWVAYTLQDSQYRKKTEEGYSLVYFTSTGVNKEVLGGDIWITNTQSGESKNLTEGKGSSWSPVWSPDGNYLAFYSDRSGVARLWVWTKSTGKLWQVSEEIVHPYYAFEVARWSPDGQRILVKILPKWTTLEDARDSIVSPQQMEKSGANSSTVLVYRSSVSQRTATGKERYEKDKWTTNRRADLALMEVATGKVQRIATGFNPAWYDFSPDGNNVAFTSAKGFESLQSQRRVYDLVLVSSSDAHPRVIAPNIRLDYVGVAVSWSPDGKRLSYITSSSSGSVKGGCYIISIDGGEPRNVTPTSHPYFSNIWRAPLWDTPGEHIYLLSTDSIWKVTVKENKAEEVVKILDRQIIEAVAPREGGRFWSPDGGRSMIITTLDDKTKKNGFCRIDLTTGKQTRLLEEERSYGDSPIFNTDISGDGKQVVFVSGHVRHCAEIWLAGVDFKNPIQVTHINPQLDKYAMGASRLIEWQGLDGEIMRGALLLPVDYQEGKRYPLIVKVYPPVKLSNNVNHFGLNPLGVGVENMQLFATRGYAVLLADSSLPKGEPMRGVAETVLPGISKVVELGIADPDRLGVMGHSNGGYGILALIVQTVRFKAAVCSAGWGNGVGFYGQMRGDGSSWGIAYEEETIGIGGPPWQFPNRYIENSPLFYLDKVHTPLLIVHGNEDSVVPPFLADEIFVGLRRLRRDVEYAKYDGEGHWQGTWSYVNQVDYLNRIINWFDKHLKNDQELKSTTKNSDLTR
jgi:dipeptidyl aminopeptidase/acylaminoacyl peptidase